MSDKPETDRMVRSTDDDRVVVKTDAAPDPIAEINELALSLIVKIEALGQSRDLIRATSLIRLAADTVNQQFTK